MERTLVILKPDAVAQKLIQVILGEINRLNLSVTRFHRTVLTEAQVREHYAHLADKPYFPKIAAFMTSGPVVLAVVDGPDAVARLRKLAGATDPRQADPQSLRGRFGRVPPDGAMENVIHCSATVNEAAQEIHRFFPGP